MTISDLLRMMGCHRIREKGFEITSSCPFAPWTHERGTDRHPSFGVNMLLNNNEGVYHCFACGKSGTVRSMIIEYCKLKGISEHNLMKYYESLLNEYSIDLAKMSKNENKYTGPTEQELEVYEKSKGRIHKLILENNIAPSTAELWGLGYDGEKIIFPVKDRLDNILFFVYRWVNGAEMKYSVSKNAPVKSCIFGENMVNIINGGPIIVVEGVLDAIYVNQMGFNSVAIFGVHAENKQINKIMGINPADIIAVLFDKDDAGIKGAADIYNKLSRYYDKVNVECLPSVRMATYQLLTNLTDGGTHVREYF